MAKVNFKRIENSENINTIDINDGNFIVTGDGKSYIDYGTNRIPTSGTPDTEMSDTSHNTVENKVIKGYVDTISSSHKPFLLWTNPNPTSAFAAQTITLSSNDYDMYEVIFYGSITGADTLATGKMPKGKNFFLQQVYNVGSGDVVRNRSIKYLSDTSMNVTDGTQSGITNNNANIPVYIIGYKY